MYARFNSGAVEGVVALFDESLAGRYSYTTPNKWVGGLLCRLVRNRLAVTRSEYRGGRGSVKAWSGAAV